MSTEGTPARRHINAGVYINKQEGKAHVKDVGKLEHQQHEGGGPDPSRPSGVSGIPGYSCRDRPALLQGGPLHGPGPGVLRHRLHEHPGRDGAPMPVFQGMSWGEGSEYRPG